MTATIAKEIEISNVMQIMKEPGSVYSYEKPTDVMIEKNEQLLKFLRDNVDEYSKLEFDVDGIGAAEQAKDNTVKQFEEIVNAWMEDVNQKRGENSIAKVVLYGSKASRTSLKSDDIDLLVLAPRLTDFFGSLYERLKSDTERVSSLVPIARAIVPIIKCDFLDFRLDIAFVTVDFDLKVVEPSSDEILLNDQILTQMDENMIRSFNAFRNVHLVCRSVMSPLPANCLSPEQRLENFRIALLCVKYWAKRFGIYGSMLGFFGGISLAIMMAKICQLYPNAPPARLLDMFFSIYQHFPWNDIAVMVAPINDHSDLDRLSSGKAYFRLKEFPAKGGHKRMMHVISPAFPQMNTTYNVSDSQLKLIETHLIESFKIIKLIFHNSLEWRDLFLSMPFFHDYDNFLEIEILSKDINEFHKWKGLIQARLRYLVGSFEQETEEKVLFQLWPQEFNLFLVSQPEWKYACFYYIGLKTITSSLETLNLTSAFKSWKKAVFEQWEGDMTTNEVTIIPKKRTELDKFVYEPYDPTSEPPKGFLKYHEPRNISSFEREPSNILSKMPMDPQGLPQVGANNLGMFMGNFNSGQPPIGLLPFPQHPYGGSNLGQPPLSHSGLGMPKPLLGQLGQGEFYGDPTHQLSQPGFGPGGTRVPTGPIMGPNGFGLPMMPGYLPMPTPNSVPGQVPQQPGFLPGQLRHPFPGPLPTHAKPPGADPLLGVLGPLAPLPQKLPADQDTPVEAQLDLQESPETQTGHNDLKQNEN